MANAPSPNPIQERLINAINESAPDEGAGAKGARIEPAPGVAAAIAEGASVNEPLPNGATPLMWAIANQKKGAVRAILDAKPELGARDRDGDSATTVATRFAPKDDLTILEMVLDAGANPNARTPSGDPAIISLMRSFNLAGIVLMARHRADVNALSRTKAPLIIEPASSQAWDVVYTLIEEGADPLVEHMGLRIADFLNLKGTTPPDSPLFPWKVKVWHYLASRGEKLSPLPDAN